MRYERTYRDASIVLAVGFVIVACAGVFLPIVPHQPSIFAEIRSDPTEQNKIPGVVAALGIAATYGLLTLVAALREPNKAIRIIGRILTAPCVLAVLATTIAAIIAMRQDSRTIPLASLVLGGLFGAAALLAYAKSFFTGPWHAWAHVLVTPPATALALFAIALSEVSPYRFNRLVGLGSTVGAVMIGIFIPLLVFVLFPRRRAV